MSEFFASVPDVCPDCGTALNTEGDFHASVGEEPTGEITASCPRCGYEETWVNE